MQHQVMEAQSRLGHFHANTGHFISEIQPSGTGATMSKTVVEMRSTMTDPPLLLPKSPKSTHQHRWFPKGWGFYISHLLCILWLAPIGLLLWFNFSEKVIGPSVWCPNAAACSSEAYNFTAFSRAMQLDKQDRDLLGFLQFVSKALEIWFGAVVVALVYDLTTLLARRDNGIPLGLILTAFLCFDLLNALHPRHWDTAKGSYTNGKRRKETLMLFMFSVFTAVLTVLVNLMGPATAVLVLPKLLWIDSPRIPVQIFYGLPLDSPPQAESALIGCSASALEAGNFSCTLDGYGTDLDEFATSAFHATAQMTADAAFYNFGRSQESYMLLVVNGSVRGSELPIWVPNRQVLKDMSKDLLEYVDPKTGRQPPTPVNDSLELKINREGPSVGLDQLFKAGNVSITTVAPGKQIRCIGLLKDRNSRLCITKVGSTNILFHRFVAKNE